jgi:hypothetical protein
MDANHIDQLLTTRLSILLAKSDDVTVHYLDGQKSKVHGPVEIGRDHLVFRDGAKSKKQVIVLFQAISRLHLR